MIRPGYHNVAIVPYHQPASFQCPRPDVHFNPLYASLAQQQAAAVSLQAFAAPAFPFSTGLSTPLFCRIWPLALVLFVLYRDTPAKSLRLFKNESGITSYCCLAAGCSKRGLLLSGRYKSTAASGGSVSGLAFQNSAADAAASKGLCTRPARLSQHRKFDVQIWNALTVISFSLVAVSVHA